MKINCDLGEGFGIYEVCDDEAMLDCIDMANIACGFHASDPMRMLKVVQAALQRGVEIGAHVSYRDIEGFGRRELRCSAQEIAAAVLYQVGALEAIAQSQKSKVSYIKPHGAMYHRMMQDKEVFEAIVSVAATCRGLDVVVQAGEQAMDYELIAKRYGVTLRHEIFADRGYMPDGTLVSRKEQGALMQDVESIIKRLKYFLQTGKMIDIEGGAFKLRADTVCVHSDTKGAITIAQRLYNHLKQQGEDGAV